MTGQEVEDIIKAQLDCDFIQITGDGRHWFGVIVSNVFEGVRPKRLWWSGLKS